MLLANRFLAPEKIRLFYEKIFVLVAPRNFHRIRRVFLRCRNHHLIESSGFAARTTKRAVIARNQCSGALQIWRTAKPPCVRAATRIFGTGKTVWQMPAPDHTNNGTPESPQLNPDSGMALFATNLDTGANFPYS